jgi:hypothetical protein
LFHLGEAQFLELELGIDLADLRLIGRRIDLEEDSAGFHQLVRLHGDISICPETFGVTSTTWLMRVNRPVGIL